MKHVFQRPEVETPGATTQTGVAKLTTPNKKATQAPTVTTTAHIRFIL